MYKRVKEDILLMKRRGNDFKNVGFISTRIAGTDGVSLEIAKWASVLERNGLRCFYFSGENDRHPERCMLVEEAHFQHPEILALTDKCFGRTHRERELTKKIHLLRDYLKEKIYNFVDEFEIDLIIPENVLAIPLNIPLALGLVEFIAETGIPTIAHHHDFSWERDRFLINCVQDYISWAFPPDLDSIQHVVINSIASKQLSFRRGISNTIVPNVYDFATPPVQNTQKIKELRGKLGFGEDDIFVLQPTRVVPRKWIERSIEIVSLLNLDKPYLIISHSADDEGDIYHKKIQDYAKNLGVKIFSIEEMVDPEHQFNSRNSDRYTIGDVYQASDLVCYPSGYEGFGNAFLEAIYYKRPIVVNRYSIYISDIEPKGFDVITLEGFVTGETIEKIKMALNDKDRVKKLTERNYSLGKRYFSYEVLERLLLRLIDILNMHCRS